MFGRRKSPYAALETAIGYRFRDRALLEAALTHRSFRFEREGVETDNQRLEFLGDAVLGFITAAHVYKSQQEPDEGYMTACRSRATSGKALAHFARQLELGQYLKMGKGEELSGGRKRPSNLADALEAVVGAAFVDGGLKAAERLFGKVFAGHLDALDDDMWAGNPKGRLQEYAQRTWKTGPVYRVIDRRGPPHAAVFTVEVALGNGSSASGEGRSKQQAETQAAVAALKQVNAEA